MFKKIVIGIIVLAVVGAGVWFFGFKEKKGPEYIVEAAKIGSLRQTVEATGKVESAQRIDLNFKTSGRISSVLVKIGDRVVQGQILARLESQAMQSRVSDAQARLDQERAAYEELMAGSSEYDIQISKDTVAQKQKDLENAENTILNLRAKHFTELSNLKEKAITDLNNQQIVAQLAIETIDNVLNDPDAVNSYAFVQANKDIAISERNIAEDNLSNIEALSSSLSVPSLDSDVLDVLEAEMQMLDSVKSALSKTMTAVTTSNTTYIFSNSDQDSMETSIQTKQGSINTARSSLVASKTAWTDKIAYYDDQEASAQDSRDAAKAALQTAQSQLEKTLSGPRQFEIDSQNAKIAQAQAALSLASANMEELLIRAPLGGIITKKYFETGEQSSISSPVLEMIGDATLEIEVDIPESDISKVSVNQPSEITLDAFSDETVLNGVVTFVDPAETLISDVVYYKVKVSFTDSGQVKPGMTANVKIITQQKENVLYVPVRSVQSRNGDKYVQILEAGIPVEKIVTTGLRADEGIEILSGIKEGDEVIMFVKE